MGAEIAAEVAAATVSYVLPAAAWGGVAAYVVTYDLWAIRTKNHTMSSGFWKALGNKWTRVPTILIWALLTTHLFFSWPNF